MTKLDLSISLLSFNTKDLLENCLNSIYKNTKNLRFEILLVDNGSRDSTPQMVEQKFSKVKLIKSAKNLLFIKAHNLNFKRATGKYFLIMNEDIEIKGPVILRMINFLKKHPKVALVSCRQVDINNHLDLTCSTLPHPVYELIESSFLVKWFLKVFRIQKAQNLIARYRYLNWQRKKTRPVEVLPGSLILARKDVLDKTGLFDEGFVFFYGEADLYQRIKKAGYKAYHLGNLTITHIKSKALSKLPHYFRYQMSEHDMLYYYKKHFGVLWWSILWIFLRPNWFYWRFLADS